MSSEAERKQRLQDEIEAVTSIYEEENVTVTKKGDVSIVTLYLPGPEFDESRPTYCPLSVSVHLPPKYLAAAVPAPLCTFSYRLLPNPSCPELTLMSSWLGQAREAEARARLSALYADCGPEGGEVLFDFFEWLREWITYPVGESLRSFTAAGAADDAAAEAADAAAEDAAASTAASSAKAAAAKASAERVGGGDKWKDIWRAAGIVQGHKIVEKKSKFIGFYASVKSMSDVEKVKSALLSCPSVAASTHNMLAYRFYPSTGGSVVADADEDGEAHAEKSMLFFMNVADVKDCFIMVSRWYGGTPLGPRRFQIIKDVMAKTYEHGKKHAFDPNTAVYSLAE